MKWLANLIFGLGTAFLIFIARADGLAVSGNPYDSIVDRNMFNLVPIPTNPPADTKPQDPPAKITPNGTMKLFGVLQVLFKVATPPKPGQPPGDQSYVMSEGDRQDGIAVTKIDEEAGMITFDNHGVIQTLPLTTGTADSGPSVASGSGSSTTPPLRRFLGGRFGRNFAGGGGSPDSSPGNPGGSPSPGNQAPVPGYGGAVMHASTANPDGLTPEAQVILMEANRQQAHQQGDPIEQLIPPTEITP